MRRTILFIIMLSGCWNYVSAASFPFMYVDSVDKGSLERVMSAGGITDKENHIFSGGTLITRDLFSQLLVSTTCTHCGVPTQGQLDAYKTASYSDVSQNNNHYYCIEESRKTNSLGPKNRCEKGENQGGTVFCSQDNVSRMEAVIALLRHAKLWDDAKNSLYTDRTIVIGDIPNTSTDYGYAVKGIQLGILKLGTDKKISPATAITQGEAVDMASRMLNYNQCKVSPTTPITGESNLLTATGKGLSYTLRIQGTSGSLYRWSMGDGYIISGTAPEVSYAYSAPGTYIASVFVYESAQKLSIHNVEISVTGDIDTDGDSVLDRSDICPTIVGIPDKKGCPQVQTGKHGIAISNLLSGITKTSNSPAYAGIRTNVCLLKYQNQQGLMLGSPVCDQCPCANSVNILADIRSCDILFPSILSPDFSMMYSRGAFYQIP